MSYMTINQKDIILWIKPIKIMIEWRMIMINWLINGHNKWKDDYNHLLKQKQEENKDDFNNHEWRLW